MGDTFNSFESVIKNNELIVHFPLYSILIGPDEWSLVGVILMGNNTMLRMFETTVTQTDKQTELGATARDSTSSDS